MRLHLLGLPHTITRSEFSHCAFTGKVLRFAPMMRSLGYDVVHYGVEGAESGANEQVDVLTREEWEALCASSIAAKGLPRRTPGSFVGDLADIGCGLYQVFNAKLRNMLRANIKDKRDIICLPFGQAHDAALDLVRENTKLETGIGYPNTCAKFRVFESSAWMHWHLGREDKPGDDYAWVIPNYFDVEEWDLGTGAGGYVLYFGRIGDLKGLREVVEIARRRPDLQFKLCGQGDPTPYLTLPNIEAIAPVHGRARSKLLGDALCLLAPTRYVEPFGGVTVEANLCGTPAITSGHGAFLETIEDGVNGYRCKTLGDYLAAIALVEGLSTEARHTIRQRAALKYDMRRLAHDYDRVFKQLDDLWGEGYLTPRSALGPVTLPEAQAAE